MIWLMCVCMCGGCLEVRVYLDDSLFHEIVCLLVGCLLAGVVCQLITATLSILGKANSTTTNQKPELSFASSNVHWQVATTAAHICTLNGKS